MLKLLEYQGETAKAGGKRRGKKRGGRNEKSRSPDIHNAVADDKGYGDSSSSLCLGLGLTLCGTHCQVKGSGSFKESAHFLFSAYLEYSALFEDMSLI